MPLAMSFSPALNSRITTSYQRAVGKAPLFSVEECDAVINWAAAKPFAVRNEFRDSGTTVRQHKELQSTPATRDRRVLAFQRKLEMIVGDLNKEVWKFDISGLLNIDVLRYEVGDQVTIHVDLNDASYHLKLAAFVQLSPANAYEGGTLEYGGAPPLDTASREQGSLLIIPAWVAHRVTPVTAGTRYSAVCWAVGPSFR